MRLQHVISQQLRRLVRRYHFLRRVSLPSTICTLIWLYVIYWGERKIFSTHIEACRWEHFETWPEGATPHHLVFVADPQLVDPHTYPGRPWPFSALTERYTDMYMARNFRLINERLDPDSVVFLGDLFDGGREWAPDKPRDLKRSQILRLQALGIRPPSDDFYGIRKRDVEGDAGGSEDGTVVKRTVETYKAALTRPHSHKITKEEHNIGPNGEDLRAFVPGENGRWSRWDNRQWVKDLRRFSSIFFAADQLYPVQSRRVIAAYDVDADPVSLENGARDAAWQEYATTGGKQRRVITSLPGNHDLGLGPGVQMVVRDRFESHFGESNRVDVIGNHTFVSLDVLSLSAHNYYKADGYETDVEQDRYAHIWQPGMDFLENIRVPVRRSASAVLKEYFPPEGKAKPQWRHQVDEPGELIEEPVEDESTADLSETKSRLPIVLLSHIPLYRHPHTPCGALRERGDSIPFSMGYQYQNVLTQALSRDIVTKVSDAGEIVAVFSGDDHDYCDVSHRFNTPPDPEEPAKTSLQHFREITVKSFSWAMGVRKPGFLLVSLWNPVDANGETIGEPLPTVQSHLCLLPDQLGIFLRYGLLLALTTATLLLHATVLSQRTPEHNPTGNDDDDVDLSDPLSLTSVSLPRFNSNSDSNDTINGSTTPKGRKRGASASSSSQHPPNSNGYLGVQRNHNARTRSVSPVGGGVSGGLIDKAGYYPHLRWTDPSHGEDSSDEESHIGSDIGVTGEDNQAKWKWRRRTKGDSWARRVLGEWAGSLGLVGVPAALFYVWVVKNG